MARIQAAVDDERWINPQRLLALTMSRTELAKYMTRMPRRFYVASMYVWARDESMRERLAGLLATEARQLWDRQQWGAATMQCPCCEMVMTPAAYRGYLSRLVVRELARPSEYASAVVRAESLGVSKSAWHRLHERRHTGLFNCALSWLGGAWGVVRDRQLVGNEESMT